MARLRRILTGTILAATLAGPALADPYPVDDRFEAEHYRFALTLSDDSDAIDVIADIDLRIHDPALDAVFLDLVRKSPDRDGRGMTVSAVSSDNEPLRFRHRDDRLEIVLPAEAAANGLLRLRIAYSGIPETGLIIGPNKHGDRSYFSDNWPNKARHWLATIDHIADKATVEFRVTAPSRLQVVSNGLEVEKTNLDNGTTLTHWQQSVPISPWLYVIGAAEFAVQRVDEFDGKEIQTWVYRQDRDAGFYDFAVPTKDALAFYSNYVGPFEYEKLANIQSNSVGGGMEAASAILYGDDSVTGERTRRWQTVIVHEVAHQWFGNSATEASWDHVWLSEGVTSYMTYVFFEHAKGREEFVRYLLDARTAALEFQAGNPDYTIVHDNLRDMANVTTRQTYVKGAWILHMLRSQIGDDAWWRGIQSYYTRYRNGLATTDDFRREMEAACDCDLAAFFDFWLHTGSALSIDGHWAWDEASGEVDIVVAQTAPDKPAPDLRVEAAIHVAGALLPTIVTIDLSDGPGSIRAAVDGRPERVTLDPNTKLLANFTFEKRMP